MILQLAASGQALLDADPTGKWGFSSKTQTFYSGKVEAAGPLGMQASELTGGFAARYTADFTPPTEAFPLTGP